MCGIAGFVDFRRRSSADELRTVADCMARRLHHRGPDDAGSWIDPEAGLVLAHAQLAIVDLSPAGAQPMQSSCGRFVLSYNGEVYNAQELRSELEAAGRKFRGHSDTEVLAEGCAVWGVDRTVRRLIGMFAFAAAFDRRERTPFLARDRLGIKPFTGDACDRRLRLRVRTQGVAVGPRLARELDTGALAAISYVPAPRTIYRGVDKLTPGTILEILPDGELHPRAYW